MALIPSLNVTRDSESQNPRGPLASLESNKFSSKDLRYPSNLGSANYNENLHYITFYINVQERSKYTLKEEYTGGGPTINSNRSADAAAGIGQIATEGIGTVGAMVAGGAMGFAAGGALGEIAGAVGGPVAGIAGAAVGGVIGGALGTYVASVDLSRKTKRIKSTISLYMPEMQAQTMTHGYGDPSMTEAMGLAGALGQGAGAIGTSIESAFTDGFANMKSSGAGALNELAGTLAEKSGVFGTGIKQAVLFSSGLALNPQVEILYQQTSHREFQFDFKFIPRNRDEAEQVRKIIKDFKFHAAPELLNGSSGRFFIPPAEFDIKFFFNGSENKNINKISTCVLTRIDVAYSPAGSWTTFQDGMPVEIGMVLAFKELELMHKGRIQDGY
jgi:Tail-tube assembly protein